MNFKAGSLQRGTHCPMMMKMPFKHLHFITSSAVKREYFPAAVWEFIRP